MNLQAGLFPRRQVGPKCKSDPPGELALELEQIGNLAVIGVVPDMLICPGIDQLRVDSHAIAFAPDRSFHDIGDSQRLPDFAQIARARFVLPNRGPAGHLQIGHPRQTRENVVLDTIREVGVLGIVAEVVEGQHGDTFFGRRHPLGPNRS